MEKSLCVTSLLTVSFPLLPMCNPLTTLDCEWRTYRCGAPSVLTLGDVWCAGCHPPAVGAAVVGLVGAQGEGTGGGRTRAKKRVWKGRRHKIKPHQRSNSNVINCIYCKTDTKLLKTTYDHLCYCWEHWQRCGFWQGKTALASLDGRLYCSPMDLGQGCGLQVGRDTNNVEPVFSISAPNCGQVWRIRGT